MKKITILILLTLVYVRGFGQQQAGDIQFSYNSIVNHDSTQCSSDILFMYSITITNSFIGDSVIVKDGQGNDVFQAENTNGTTPWMVNFPLTDDFMVQDDELDQNNDLNFMAEPMSFWKIISGNDTLFSPSIYAGQHISDPCSYGKITGRVYLDNDNDCTYSTGDTVIYILPAINRNYTNFTGNGFNGGFNYGTQMYDEKIQTSYLIDYTVSIPSYYAFAYAAPPCFSTSYHYTTAPQSNVDFPLQCEAGVDTRVLSWYGVVRPGEAFNLSPEVYNIGCHAVSGMMKLVLDPNVIYNPSNSVNPADSISGDTLMWHYSNLNNLSNSNTLYFNQFIGNIDLTPNSSLGIGDVLHFKLLSSVDSADVNPSNNKEDFSITLVASYDPNIKKVSPKGTGPQGIIADTTKTLTYTVDFQNTGTAPAINVSVIDTLNANINPRSLKILGVSHSMNPQWLDSNIIKFTFSNINLPDTSVSMKNSQGFVRFKVDLNSNLAPGTEIKNTADIYFDANPAIVTNTTLNTIETPSTSGIDAQAIKRLNVYPNPTKGLTNFKLTNTASGRIIVQDMLGNKVAAKVFSQTNLVKMNLNRLGSGIYIYSLFNTDTGSKTSGKILVK